MDIRALTLFLNLADTLHFGRASELSHISPSALSRAIKQLEESVGVALFERNNRTVVLTYEGEKFRDYARDTVMQWGVIRDELMEESGELHGELSVYCSVTASYSFLYDILSEFRLNHPAVEIKLHTGDPDLALSRVVSGAEDISIAAKPETLPGGVSFKPIAETPLQFIAPKNADAIDQQIAASDWANTPMILPETGMGRQRVEAWFAAQGMQPTIYAQVAGNEAIVSMVSLGFGVGVVPRIVLDNSPLAASVEIINTEPALEPYEVGLFTLNKKLKSPLTRAFWSLLKP
ncbi:MAG: HTH-type transcriptional activator IlvY [Pontibacterium sp.]